ncbi:hypothetical protein FO519_006233, partial [Halicephalobus sp. NKZ332]
MSSQPYDPNKTHEKESRVSGGPDRGVANRSATQLYSKRKRQASNTLNSNKTDDRNIGSTAEKNQVLNSLKKSNEVSTRKQNEKSNSKKTMELNAVEPTLCFNDFGGCEEQLL